MSTPKPGVPRDELERRLRSLQERMARADPLDAAVLVQNVDLYYFAGTIQTSHLLVPAEGSPRLLVRKVLERARQDSALEDVRPMSSLRALADELGALCGPRPWRIGMELDVIPSRAAEAYRARLGDGVEIVDISGAVLDIRSVKSDWEIERIRESARINDRLYEELPGLWEDGMSTLCLQARLDCRARELGHVGLVRMRGFNIDGLIGVCVSGPTGALPGHSEFPIGGLGPHPVVAHGGDPARIERDTPIAFDYLANGNGYHHDQTRMAVVGAMPDEAMRIYEAMRSTLREIEERLAPGAIPSDIYEAALESIAARGLGEGFLGPAGHAVPFVGHAVGLEVNEIPVLARKFEEPLVAGNVLAVEPKFTHPQLGVIGVENTYVVRAGGVERIGATAEEIVRIEP